MLRHLLFLSILSLSVAHRVAAQEELSLSRAIEIGLENRYQIQIAEKNLEIAENDNQWAVAGRYPSIDFVLDGNSGYTKLNNPASFLRQTSSLNAGIRPGVEASWTLFEGYRVRFSKQQLEELQRGSQVDLRIAVENTIQNIILSYYQALIQQEQLEVVEEVLQLSRDRVEFEEVKREFGQVSTFDVLQTQDAYLNDSTNYLRQLNTYQNALRNLKLDMGLDDFSQSFLLTTQLDSEPMDYDLESLTSRMVNNNQQLQNLQVDRELARINTKIQESQLYPSLNLRAGTTYNVSISSGTQTFLEGGERDIPTVAAKTLNPFFNLSLRYNIFDAGVRQNNIDNAQLGEINAQYRVAELRRQLNAQLLNTFATYQTQKELVRVTDELVSNAQRNLEIAEERFRGGLINSFDYRTIQLSYINATQARFNAIFNLKTTETELTRLIGGLVR